MVQLTVFFLPSYVIRFAGRRGHNVTSKPVIIECIRMNGFHKRANLEEVGSERSALNIEAMHSSDRRSRFCGRRVEEYAPDLKEDNEWFSPL